MIELYNARLDERIRRKKFVIERGLLDLKKVQKFERKKSKEEREIINSMKIFARFNTEEEHNRLVNSLLKEKLLREVIDQLKYFKAKGLTSLDSIEKFIEAQKVKNKSQGNNNKDYHRSDAHPMGENGDELGRFINAKEEFLGARKVSGSGQKQGGANTAHLQVDADKWKALNSKEKEFCTRLNMKPESYCNLKRMI